MASVSEGAAGRVSTGALAGARVSLAAGGAAAGATSARVRVLDGPHAGAVRFVRLASVAFDPEWNAEVKGHPQEQTKQQALQHDQALAQVHTQEQKSHQQPQAKTSRGAATAARCEADTRVAAAIASASERQRERDKVLAEAKARAASEDAERNRQREEYDDNPGAFMKNMPPPPSEEQLEESRKNVERMHKDPTYVMPEQAKYVREEELKLRFYDDERLAERAVLAAIRAAEAEHPLGAPKPFQRVKVDGEGVPRAECTKRMSKATDELNRFTVCAGYWAPRIAEAQRFAMPVGLRLGRIDLTEFCARCGCRAEDHRVPEDALAVVGQR